MKSTSFFAPPFFSFFYSFPKNVFEIRPCLKNIFNYFFDRFLAKQHFLCLFFSYLFFFVSFQSICVFFLLFQNFPMFFKRKSFTSCCTKLLDIHRKSNLSFFFTSSFVLLFQNFLTVF